MVETEAAPATPATKKAKSAAKPRKPKTAPTHPKVADMVNKAISDLKEKGGSSLQAIKKYISSHYKVDIERLSPFIRKYLKNAVSNGGLVQTKGKGASGSFRMQGPVGKAKGKSEKPKKTTTAVKKPKTAVKKTAAKAAKKPAAAKKPKKAKSPKKAKAASKPKAAKPKKAAAKRGAKAKK